MPTWALDALKYSDPLSQKPLRCARVNSCFGQGLSALFFGCGRASRVVIISFPFGCSKLLDQRLLRNVTEVMCLQVHFLDLRYNALRVQGTMALVQHLRHLRALKSVVLEGNGVEEPDDVMAVEKSLRGVRVWLNVGARIA